MAPPAEALGSGSPHGPRDPSRTCSGLRPPEAGRARASRKVREPGKGGELGGGHDAGLGAGGTLGAPRLRCRPVADGRPRAVPEAGATPGPRRPDAGTARALGARLAQPPGSRPGRAGRSGPPPRSPKPRLRNGSSQQPKFCLVPRGAPRSGSAALGRRYGDLVPFH